MRVYFAGTLDDTSAIPLVLEGTVINLFPSYFAVANKTLAACDLLDLEVSAVRKHEGCIVWDSGAHSFFSASGGAIGSAGGAKKKTGDLPTPAEYFSEFYRWVIANHEYLADFVVELDIGEIVGQQTVNRWRRLWERAGLAQKLITCYHPALHSFADFKAMLKDSASRYVALEGLRNMRCNIDYRRFVDEAYAAGVRVHGFAMTNVQYTLAAPFYSVDSTSWKAAIRWGNGPMPSVLKDGNAGGIQYREAGRSKGGVRPSQERLDYLAKYVRDIKAFSGCATVKSRGYVERCREGIYGTLQFEQRVTDYWKRQGYDWTERMAREGVVA